MARIVGDPNSQDLWFTPDYCPTGRPKIPSRLVRSPEGRVELYQPDEGALPPPSLSGAFGAMIRIEDAPADIRDAILKREIHISRNAKTVLSFNTRISRWDYDINGKQGMMPGTCKPTAWCTKHCYAKKGLMGMKWAGTSWRNLSEVSVYSMANVIVTTLMENDPQEVIDREAADIIRQVRATGIPGTGRGGPRLDNLRMCGGGDLNLGLIRLIRAMAKLDPTFIIWGFTKRGDLATHLPRARNVRFRVSIDYTTPPYMQYGGVALSPVPFATQMKAARQLHHGIAYATEQQMDQHLPRIAADVLKAGSKIDVLFGYHCGLMHLTEISAGRGPLPAVMMMECAATHPRIHAQCQVCRWCMTRMEDRPNMGMYTPVQSFFDASKNFPAKMGPHVLGKEAKQGIPPMTRDEAMRRFGPEALRRATV